MNKTFIQISILLVILGALTLPSLLNREVKNPGNAFQVSTSFYPLYFFASEIGGEKVDVTNITPAGVEPHEYEPTAQDIVTIEKSSLLILNGGGLESWGERIRGNDELREITILAVGEDAVDPHRWLFPLLAREMAEKIEATFEKIDPRNSQYYRENLAALTLKLVDLDTRYRSSLSDCKGRTIITSHAAFGHMAAAYNLTQLSISGISPDAEPSSRSIASVAKFAKENKINYIFFESLVSPKLSETIAREVGAQTLVLNPLEGLSESDLLQGKNYFTEMESNLKNLTKALQCTTR